MTNRFFLSNLQLMLVVLAAVTGLLGCKQEEKIARHRIEKSRSGLGSLRKTAASAPNKMQPQVAKDRMVVALYLMEDATWFFKLTGPIKNVTESVDQWEPFFENVKFESGKPTWDLPAGWSKGPAKPMRFETLVVGDFQPPLEMAISSLGPNQDLLLNVNRWRKQMGLDDISKESLDDQLRPLSVDGGEGYLFDISGTSTGGMRPPFAGGAPMGETPMKRTPSKTSSSGERVQFETPAGWEKGRVSSMVPVRLSKQLDDQSAQITVVVMPAAVNEWAPNAKRWAGEIGLTKLTDSELETRTNQMNVDGIEGQQIRLIDENADRATIAGMVKRGDDAWFLKLTGDRDIVEKQESTFSEFLKTVRLPN